MDLDRLNKWATLAANLGVAVGIFFLAFELNQNSRVTEAQIFQSRAETAIHLRLALTHPPELVTLLASFDTGPYGPTSYEALADLNPEERIQMMHLHGVLATQVDNLHYQYENGFLEQEYYDEVVVPAVRTFCGLWPQLGTLVATRPSFRKMFDAECQSTPS